MVARRLQLDPRRRVEIVRNVRCSPLGVDLAIGRAVKPILDEKVSRHLGLQNKVVQTERQTNPDGHVFDAVFVLAQFGH